MNTLTSNVLFGPFRFIIIHICILCKFGFVSYINNYLKIAKLILHLNLFFGIKKSAINRFQIDLLTDRNDAKNSDKDRIMFFKVI